MKQKEKAIGIIGYRGTVGREIVSILEGKYSILKGGRQLDRNNENICYVDVFDNKSLMEFCKKCSVLINATGPSYLIGDRIAKIACDENVKYIDVFGGGLLYNMIKPYANKGRFVINAGCVPGLSGILVKHMFLKTPEQQDIKVFHGGRESGGIAGLTDLILSIIHGYGHSGMKLVHGEKKAHSAGMPLKIFHNGFPEPVYQNAYLTEELISLAAGRCSMNIASYQIFPDNESVQLLTEGSLRYSISETNSERKEIIKEISNRQKEIIAGKKEWFVMLAENKCESKKNRILLRCRNSTILTAFIAAMCAERLAEESGTAGLDWAHKLLDSVQVIAGLQQYGVNIVFTEENLMPIEMIEGEI